MDLLKKIWPTPFKIEKGNVGSLLIQLIIFLVLVVIFGFVIGLLAKLPIINLFGGIIGGLVEVYNIVGIVLCVLKFFAVVE